LELALAKCEDKLPPYTDLPGRDEASWCLSGVYGEEFTTFVLVVVRCRGEGVRGIRPPAIRVEKRPLWDLRGVDTAADAIVSDYLMNNSRVVSRE
jgi:hypothetical protein